MSEKKLLRCPFCGGEAIICHASNCVFIRCSVCRALMGETCKSGSARRGRLSFDTEKEAIESWNTRVPMESIVKELELKQEESFKLYAIAFDPEDRGGFDAYSDAIDIVKEEGGLND